MHGPGSPLLKTTLPTGKLTLAPAFFANSRISMSLPRIIPRLVESIRLSG
jgi:hypothetical protein